MNSVIAELSSAYAEIFLLAMACIILIVDLFLDQAHRHISYLLALVTLMGCAVITAVGGRLDVVYAFNGMFVDDLMSDSIKLILYIAVVAFLTYSRAYTIARDLFHGEFFALALFGTLGMMVMVSANHFLTLYLGLELLSLSLYSMVALQRDSAIATEAAMKYFVLGALASGLLLYGMSMLYGATGSLGVGAVADSIVSGRANQTVLVFGLVFVVAGMAFKLGAAPFHMWVPDVYHGASTAVTLFIGSAAKLAAFAFVLRLLIEGLQPLVADWQDMLVILAVLSMAIGNITAIAQSNLKRMLAYSSISHMGFMLLGLVSGKLDGYSSAMFYMIVYVLMSLGTFGMIMVLSREGFEAENIEDFKGLNQRSPWLALIMGVFMLSMAGLPPTVGFFAKLEVLNAVLGAGYVWLVVLAVLISVIGAFYYLRVVKLMYFDNPDDHSPIHSQSDLRLLMSANGIAIVFFGILPQPLIALCMLSIRHSLLL